MIKEHYLADYTNTKQIDPCAGPRSHSPSGSRTLRRFLQRWFQVYSVTPIIFLRRVRY